MVNRFEGTEWITAEGIRINPKDMTTKHIINSINMLQKNPRLIKAMLKKDELPNTVVGLDLMSGQDLILYVYANRLFKTMLNELGYRNIFKGASNDANNATE